MTGKRLRLILDPEPSRTLSIGVAVPIAGTVEVENVNEGGTVRVDVDSRCLALLSPEVLLLPPGSYSKRIEWSVGTIASSKVLPDGVAVVNITASADTLMRTAQVFLKIA